MLAFSLNFGLFVICWGFCVQTCVYKCTYHIVSKRVLGFLLYHSLPNPLRRDLSLILGFSFSWLSGKPTSPSGPPVPAPLRAGRGTHKMPGLSHGCWDPDSNPHDWEAGLLNHLALSPALYLLFLVAKR